MHELEQGRENASWYKDAVVYELHVRSFYDSNGDGIGDFPGLTQKLDYLADLGITAIWLLPFYPSPLRDGGYDISDYRSIDPAYGTMKDWKGFLSEAHARGLRVITELVVNHTSDQHPWFQRSRRASPGSRWREYYVWSQDPKKYQQARVIFKDFELSNWTWDPVAQSYFWHRFYSHQPDLNFENPQVRNAIFQVIDFWFDQGVDGFRLDAVPYLYERENTSCENLPETHGYLKELRSHVDSKYRDRVLLAEANQWPEEAVSYFGEGVGDECHMAFHFPLMPRLFMGIQMEDRVPIIDILEQTPALPESGQWALFLRNHDELTLEMVTDEERDYMYRVYARDTLARLNLGIRRRLAPLLGNDRRKIELLNVLLLSMPGTPVIYYGDEIGMGDNIYLGDRDGVRTPMQWNSDKNAGFSRAKPASLRLPVVSESEYHYESVNVEAQQGNENSLLWWTKKILHLRKHWRAFGRGSLQFIPTGNRKVLAFVRQYESECVLVTANLSRLPQPAELKLSEYNGYCPVELRGNVEFPAITEHPYSITFSPYAAFWLWLRPAAKPADTGGPLREVFASGNWRSLLNGEIEGEIKEAVIDYLERQPWYMAKGRRIEAVKIPELLEVPGRRELVFAILLLEFLEGEDEQYSLPLLFASGQEAQALARPELLIAKVRGVKTPRPDSQEQIGEPGSPASNPGGSDEEPSLPVLVDAIGSALFWKESLGAIAGRRSWKGVAGVCRTWKTQPRVPSGEDGQGPCVLANRSNSCVTVGNCFFKLFRKLEAEVNPEIEIEIMLAHKRFPCVPSLIGTLTYYPKTGGELSLGVVSRTISDCENAWSFTLQALDFYWDHFLASPPRPGLEGSRSLLKASEGEFPAGVEDLAGSYLEFARFLGQRTGELHVALADPEQRGFAPEPFTPFYLRSLYQSQRNRVMEAAEALRTGLASLNPDHQAMGVKLLAQKTEIFSRLKSIYRPGLQGMRIRCHGSFQLQEVLSTGKDFYFIDFEGDPSRPASERRIKRPSAFDLAKMIHSFHLAALGSLESRAGTASREQWEELQKGGGTWAYWASVSFLKGYLKAINGSALAQSAEDLELLLNCHLVDRGAKEVSRAFQMKPSQAGTQIAAWTAMLRLGNL